jgi:hypothetical protein
MLYEYQSKERRDEGCAMQELVLNLSYLGFPDNKVRLLLTLFIIFNIFMKYYELNLELAYAV